MSVPPRESEWWSLVDSRRRPLGQFLAWARDRERQPETSLRLANRDDLSRAREILPLFEEPWWGVVVYSCFDSVVGARAVSKAFATPLPAPRARASLARLRLSVGSVQYHRTQAGHRGAKLALHSASANAKLFFDVLHHREGFADRFAELRRMNLQQWGRTTCFDLLIRAGLLEVSGNRYEPDRVYLASSTGPKEGFRRIWGRKVTASNEEACEAMLRTWSQKWKAVARRLGVTWRAESYGPGDLENALCIFQDKRAR